MRIFEYITIDPNSRKPKYRQIVDCIVENIGAGNIMVDEKIPSINSLSERFILSRDTVEKAYNILKKRNIITPVKGKGFYVTDVPLKKGNRILFLINKLSAYKMRIYNSFVSSVGPDVQTDLDIYHCDESLFLALLERDQHGYDYFVIMPHFKTDELRHTSTTDKVTRLLRSIPDNKLVILDNHLSELAGDFAEVYQDFEMDIYEALKQGESKIQQYEKAVLGFPSRSVYPYPRRILRGFRHFCVEAKISFEVIDKIEEDHPLEAGTLYLTIPEEDLVNLVKAARDQGLTPGKDIGIISYNETPLKDLLGITTISTNFDQMGRTSARLITEKKRDKIKNPFVLTNRDSL
ncbi:GntR family transcriptional regulator [Neolewinella antarctica]|uniref:DNA-binding transcriptional regulator YhcF (GntR family) n=1 Tax=Neolewinella antarctica TaxID=442734 RepID=A0ABX0XGK2_9BACT|nr:GntR family transcriptional regulator [Neolewinella antarctica]NJC28464.1 DNA-binding transcriptional regulator YhcF (GntR family) [Neolewinella antarctica]